MADTPMEQKLMQDRIQKLNELRAKGINPYPYTYSQTHHSGLLHHTYKDLEAAAETQDVVSVAGRVMLVRRMGKASFATILDQEGNIQAFFKSDILGQKYDLLKYVDMGDFIGVSGRIFKTKTGELSVMAEDFTILAKSIRPLPEKFHGLQDTELRYRNRHLDLIMNPEVRKTFAIRSRVISCIRKYLDAKGFLEVETPTLQPIYGGAAARPFTTLHNTLNMKLYLRISDELYLKRLIVGGFEKVYEITKDFRNEGIDRKHNPEFTMLELYFAYTDYNDIMKLTEEMVAECAKSILGATKIKYGDVIIDLAPPWERLTMKGAILKYAQIDVDNLDDRALKDLVTTYNLEIKGEEARGNIILALFDELCESRLVQPVFITDHPVESTPLCKMLRNGDQATIERFEPYIAGMEVGNAYSELNDPIMQRTFLEKQAAELRAGNEESNPMDEDFVEAIETGMPPTGGLGLGIDRIAMLLTNSPSIRDVIFFPTMRPDEK